MKLTSAPLARSSSAIASAGTTCPAVPPAAITILGIPRCSRSRIVEPPYSGRSLLAPIGRTLLALVAVLLDQTQVSLALLPPLPPAARLDRNAALGDVAKEPHRREQNDQAAVAVGDERQRNA